jgi:hypothetical protein
MIMNQPFCALRKLVGIDVQNHPWIDVVLLKGSEHSVEMCFNFIESHGSRSVTSVGVYGGNIRESYWASHR